MRNSLLPTEHSIYHNAMPHYNDRADLCAISSEGEDFAFRFIGDFLKKNFEIQFDASETGMVKASHLYFQSRNYERTQGVKTLGIGYPMFVTVQENELLVSPLFYWSIELEPAQAKPNAWVIRWNDQSRVNYNQHIANQIKANFDVDYTAKLKSFCSEKSITAKELNEFLEGLAKDINFHYNSEMGIYPSPTIANIGEIAEKGVIHKSAIISLFTSQNNFQKTKTTVSPDLFISEALPFDEALHPFGLLPLNQDQGSAVYAVRNNSVTLIEGNSNSGKVHTLVHLLTNALSNGQKCLVVSDRIAPLKKAQSYLSKVGIDQFNYLLKDEKQDRKLFLDMLRIYAENANNIPDYPKEKFDVLKGKTQRMYTQLAKEYEAVSRPILGDYNWPDVVGLFLRSNRLEGRELLGSQLSKYDFKFDTEEFDDLKNAIITSSLTYPAVNTLTHPLTEVHSSVFTMREKDDGWMYVKQNLQAFTNKSKALQHEIIGFADKYSIKLKGLYEEYYLQFYSRLKYLRNTIADYSNEYGNDFVKSGNASLKISGIFSSRSRDIKVAREEVAITFKNLQTHFEKTPYFDFQFNNAIDGTNVSLVNGELDRFEQELGIWKNKIGATIQDEMQRLNSRTANPNIELGVSAKDLETALHNFTVEINGAKVLARPIENKTLTLSQSRKYLEQLIELFASVDANLRDFNKFQPWQKNWLGLGAAGQKLIKACVKTNPKDWIAAYESWYYHNCLLKNESEFLPKEEQVLIDYANHLHHLLKIMPAQIKNLWTSRRGEGLRRCRREDKQLASWLFKKDVEDMPLDVLFEKGLEVISDFFPVLMMNTETAHQLLSTQQKEQFDYIILCETNRIGIESTAFAQGLSKRLVIISEDTLEGDLTLGDYSKDAGAKQMILNNRYRIATNNERANMRLENVEGRFDKKKHTNDVEAQHIINLINKIQQTSNRTYSSVGIVTSTPEQRDLIASYLLKIKQKEGASSEKIRQLERNGLGVFTLNELYGQNFDLLIVSLTYGAINLQGDLTPKIHSLNTSEGIRLLHLLINRTFKNTYILNSIPAYDLKQFLKNPAEEGTNILAHFLKYVSTLQAGRSVDQEEFEYLLPSNQLVGKQASDIEKEVAISLRSYLGYGRLHKDLILDDEVNLALTVKPLHGAQPLTSIQTDLFFSQAEFTDFGWEFNQKRKLAEAKINSLPIYSVNWWKDPLLETRKLASELIKLDKTFNVVELGGDEEE